MFKNHEKAIFAKKFPDVMKRREMTKFFVFETFYF